MKKLFACAALSLMLVFGAATVSAAPSPTTTPVPGHEDPSPKTADTNIIYIEGLGAVLLAAAAFAGVRAKKYA